VAALTRYAIIFTGHCHQLKHDLCRQLKSSVKRSPPPVERSQPSIETQVVLNGQHSSSLSETLSKVAFCHIRHTLHIPHWGSAPLRPHNGQALHYYGLALLALDMYFTPNHHMESESGRNKTFPTIYSKALTQKNNHTA